MIIYGSRTIGSTAGTGNFHCPLCKTHRGYQHIVNKRYFTLYFIPLFPIYKQGDFVQCTSCGEGFATEAIHAPPAAGSTIDAPTQQFDDLRRGLLLILVEARRVDSDTLARLRQWCHNIGLHDTTDQLIHQELSLAQQAGVSFTSFAGAKLYQLNKEQRKALVAGAAQILGGAMRPTPAEQQELRQMAVTLQLTPSELDFLSAN